MATYNAFFLPGGIFFEFIFILHTSRRSRKRGEDVVEEGWAIVMKLQVCARV